MEKNGPSVKTTTSLSKTNFYTIGGSSTFSGGLYDPSTHEYVSPSGQGYSVLHQPTGSFTFNTGGRGLAKTTHHVYVGGGGGSSRPTPAKPRGPDLNKLSQKLGLSKQTLQQLDKNKLKIIENKLKNAKNPEATKILKAYAQGKIKSFAERNGTIYVAGTQDIKTARELGLPYTTTGGMLEKAINGKVMIQRSGQWQPKTLYKIPREVLAEAKRLDPSAYLITSKEGEQKIATTNKKLAERLNKEHGITTLFDQYYNGRFQRTEYKGNMQLAKDIQKVLNKANYTYDQETLNYITENIKKGKEPGEGLYTKKLKKGKILLLSPKSKIVQVMKLKEFKRKEEIKKMIKEFNKENPWNAKPITQIGNKKITNPNVKKFLKEYLEESKKAAKEFYKKYQNQDLMFKILPTQTDQEQLAKYVENKLKKIKYTPKPLKNEAEKEIIKEIKQYIKQKAYQKAILTLGEAKLTDVYYREKALQEDITKQPIERLTHGIAKGTIGGILNFPKLPAAIGVTAKKSWDKLMTAPSKGLVGGAQTAAEAIIIDPATSIINAAIQDPETFLMMAVMTGAVKEALPKYGRIRVPVEKGGEKTVWKGLYWQPGRTKPFAIIGKTSKGIKIGTPKVSLPEGLKAGYVPTSKLETRMMEQGITEKLKPSEATRFKAGLEIGRIAGKQKIRINNADLDFTKIKYLPKGGEALGKWLKKQKATIYGSFIQKAQMTNKAIIEAIKNKNIKDLIINRETKDLDIQFRGKGIAAAKAAEIYNILKKYYKKGEIRINPNQKTLVEIKMNGRWHHALDIHDDLSPLGEVSSSMSRGEFGYGWASQKPINIQGYKLMTLAEQARRKIASSLGVHAEKGVVNPLKHRVKDIGDAVAVSTYIKEAMKKGKLSKIFKKKEIAQLEKALNEFVASRPGELSRLAKMLKQGSETKFVIETGTSKSIPISISSKQISAASLLSKGVVRASGKSKSISRAKKTPTPSISLNLRSKANTQPIISMSKSFPSKSASYKYLLSPPASKEAKSKKSKPPSSPSIKIPSSPPSISTSISKSPPPSKPPSSPSLSIRKTPPVLPSNTLPLASSYGIKKTKRKRVAHSKVKKEYKPSLGGIVYGVRVSKAPKFVTGAGIRGIVSKTVKKAEKSSKTKTKKVKKKKVVKKIKKKKKSRSQKK